MTFIAGAMAGAVPACAAENGIGFYLLGSRGPMAGYLPPPGVYLQNDLYHYSGTGGGGKIFSTGGRLIADVESQATADFVTGTWVLPFDVLGGNLAVGAILPYGHVNVDAGLQLFAPRLNAVFNRDIGDSASVFGDPVFSTTLGWHAENFHWNVTLLVNTPVGNYRENALANLSFNRWANDLSGALTWFDPKLGIDLSGVVGITFNGTNDVTDYTTGTEFHVEWAATKTLSKEWSIGILGYYYQQLTGDSGSGATLGAYEGRIAAIGGTIAYNFEVGKTPVSTRLKVFQEFAAENRLEGTLGYFTVAFPLITGK
ncbi:transporter [Aquabacter sp. CN5-332]|uniref:SphA family protein n=1 Tax=Aquabacter sp. CN5-332 TaxID=3156608 RepID=UPI0032B608E0